MEKRQVAYNRERYRDELDAAMRHAGVPFEFTLPTSDPRHKSLDTFKTDTPDRLDIVLAARGYLRGAFGPTWLYLHGPTDCGKSHIAAAMIARRVELAVQQGIETYEQNGMQWAKLIRDTAAGSAIYAKYLRIITELTDSFHDKSERAAGAVLDRYTNVGLLAIDDLGAEQVSEYAVRMLYWLIDAREEKGRPTIITSNYAIDALIDRLDRAGGDRIEAERIGARLQRKCFTVEMNERFLDDSERID